MVWNSHGSILQKGVWSLSSPLCAQREQDCEDSQSLCSPPFILIALPRRDCLTLGEHLGTIRDMHQLHISDEHSGV